MTILSISHFLNLTLFIGLKNIILLWIPHRGTVSTTVSNYKTNLMELYCKDMHKRFVIRVINELGHHILSEISIRDNFGNRHYYLQTIGNRYCF
jgi:hypothetical protein